MGFVKNLLEYGPTEAAKQAKMSYDVNKHRKYVKEKMERLEKEEEENSKKTPATKKKKVGDPVTPEKASKAEEKLFGSIVEPDPETVDALKHDTNPKVVRKHEHIVDDIIASNAMSIGKL